MREQQEKLSYAKPIPTVRDVIDREFMTIGDAFGKIWTREELDEYHRIGDLLDEKIAMGYTQEQVDAEWKGKLSEEILANADANGISLHTAPVKGERAA